MAVLMDLCGVCVALHLCAGSLLVAQRSDPYLHGAASLALVIAGASHSKAWALSTTGFMLTLCVMGGWAAVTGVSPDDAEVVARAALGASASWYVAALLQPSRTFIASHIAIAAAAGAALRTPLGVEAAQRAVQMYRRALGEPAARQKHWWFV